MCRRARRTARSWSCSEERRSSPSSSAMTPTLTESALEQPVPALELRGARRRDGGRSRLAVDAPVDRAVGLARAAGDRGDQRASLVAQPLAALVGRLAGRPRRRGGGRRRREGGERGRRRGGLGLGLRLGLAEELKRVA